MQLDEVRKMDVLSDRELTRILGSFLLEAELSATPPTPGRMEAEGRDWLRKNREQLQSRVCGAKVVRQYLENGSRLSERITLCAAIADLILGSLTGVAAVAVAVMIVREGLASFCPKSA